MKNLKRIAALVIMASSLLITGCGSDMVSGATAEEQRTIARTNSKLAANKFISENPQYNAFKVIPNGDSTIDRSCPQGDGWASLKLINDNNEVYEI